MRRVAALALVAACHAASATSHGVKPEAGSTGPQLSEFTIPGAQKPRDPWPHSSGGIYFSMTGSDRIVRFDAATRQFREWALPADAKPHGVAVSLDGTIFYAGYGDSTIGELEPRSGRVRQHRLSDPNGRPYGIALDGRGNVWVTLRAGGVTMLEPSSGRLTEYKMDGEPYGLAFDRDGLLWVTCIGADKLRRLDPKSGAVTEVLLAKGSKPRRLAIAADGKVWVSLYGSGRLAAVDGTSGKVVKEYPMPGGPNSGPYSVNAGPGGRIWVTEFQSDTIAILDTATGAFKTVSLPARSGVRNASIDALGRFWFISSGSGKIGLIE